MGVLFVREAPCMGLSQGRRLVRTCRRDSYSGFNRVSLTSATLVWIQRTARSVLGHGCFSAHQPLFSGLRKQRIDLNDRLFRLEHIDVRLEFDDSSYLIRFRCAGSFSAHKQDGTESFEFGNRPCAQPRRYKIDLGRVSAPRSWESLQEFTTRIADDQRRPVRLPRLYLDEVAGAHLAEKLSKIGREWPVLVHVKVEVQRHAKPFFEEEGTLLDVSLATPAATAPERLKE